MNWSMGDEWVVSVSDTLCVTGDGQGRESYTDKNSKLDDRQYNGTNERRQTRLKKLSNTNTTKNRG